MRKWPDDLQLLTVGETGHSVDGGRTGVEFAYPNRWPLLLRSARLADAGTYLCHVSTDPPLIRRVRLRVTGTRRLVASPFFFYSFFFVRGSAAPLRGPQPPVKNAPVFQWGLTSNVFFAPPPPPETEGVHGPPEGSTAPLDDSMVVTRFRF